MKKNLINQGILFIVFASVMILSSCKKDSSSADAIVGTWTAGTPTYTAMVGTLTLHQYFTDVMMLPADQTALAEAFFTASLDQNFTGTVQIKSDNTYSSNLGGTTDTGTWSLNSGRTMLTITPTSGDPMTFTVVELTSTKLHVQAVETITQDLNSDGTDETIVISLDFSFTK